MPRVKKESTPIKSESSIKNQELRVKLPDTSLRETARSTRGTSLSIPVYSLTGRKTSTLALPKEIFGQKVNKQLLAQAIRVYSTNQKHLTGSTKTRGEVEGSTVKIYRQKGTGRARHGAIRAPIFVGGGIVFGPKPRQVRLNLPQKMKKAALISALSAKLADKNIIGLAGEGKASGKTKEMVVLIKKLSAIGYSPLATGKKQKANSQQLIANSVLIVTGEKQEMVARAVRNIPGAAVLPANLINAYEVLRHELLLVTKEAVNVILGVARMTIKGGKQE